MSNKSGIEGAHEGINLKTHFPDGTPRVCSKCRNYAIEAIGLCGNCLTEKGDSAANYDPVLQHRKAIRKREEETGKFPHAEVEALQLAAMDRPPQPSIPGMRKLEEGTVKHEGKGE